MTQTRRIDVISESISSAAQMFHAASVEILTSAAPVFGMVPSAILTAIHLHEIMGLWAIPATFGIDAIGISLATIRASLPRMDMTQHDKSVRDDFRYYLFVTVGINVSLSVYVNFFKSGDPINSIGPFIAETFLSFLPYFVAKIIALNAEQAAKVAAQDDAKATEALSAAQAFEESERAKDSQLQRQIQLMREKSALKVAEKLATVEVKLSEVSQPKTTTPQPETTKPGKIDPVVLRAALVAKHDETHDNLAKLFGVSGAAVGKHIKTRGGRDAIISG